MPWGLKLSVIKAESSLPDKTFTSRNSEGFKPGLVTDCSDCCILKCQRWILFNLVAGGEREAPLRLSGFCPSPVRLRKSSLLETLWCWMVWHVFPFTLPQDNSFFLGKKKPKTKPKNLGTKNSLFVSFFAIRKREGKTVFSFAFQYIIILQDFTLKAKEFLGFLCFSSWKQLLSFLTSSDFLFLLWSKENSKNQQTNRIKQGM